MPGVRVAVRFDQRVEIELVALDLASLRTVLVAQRLEGAPQLAREAGTTLQHLRAKAVVDTGSYGSFADSH